MAIFHVGMAYSLQKPKNPSCRDFPLRVATLQSEEAPALPVGRFSSTFGLVFSLREILCCCGLCFLGLFYQGLLDRLSRKPWFYRSACGVLDCFCEIFFY